MDLFVAQPPVNHSLTPKPLAYKNNSSHATVIKLLSKDFFEVPQTRINTGFLKHFKLFKLAKWKRTLNFLYRPFDSIWLDLIPIIPILWGIRLSAIKKLSGDAINSGNLLCEIFILYHVC